MLSGNIGAIHSYHVVTADDVDHSAVLDGFTISDGSFNAGAGAGIYIPSGTGPVVVRCKLTGNSAAIGGAVFFGFGGSFADPTFVNCSFIANFANQGGAMWWKLSSAHATLVNCLFANNTAVYEGGAISPGGGGAGGASIVNCTFANNLAPQGRAIYAKPPGTIVTNSILWGGLGQIGQDLTGNVTVSYSDVEMPPGEVYPGTENINADPLFMNFVVGNFRLRNMPVVSLCIDTGSDAAVPCDDTNLDDDLLVGCPPSGELLPWDRDTATPFTHWGRMFNVASGQGSKVDMGAYETQQITACRWDIASIGGGSPPDGQVAINDFLALYADWGSCPGCGADFDNDLMVGITDLLELLAVWGCCPLPCPPQGDAPSSGGGSDANGSGLTPEDAVLLMGFASLDNYQAWLAQASDEEAYTSVLLLAAILGGG